MTAKLIVQTELVDRFNTKSGPKEVFIARGVEVGSEHNLGKIVDYQATDEERRAYEGKLKGKTAEIGITEAKEGFGGRLRVSGRIVKVV